MAGSTIHEIPLGGGMDQKVSVEWLNPDERQSLVQDGYFPRVGSVEKRLGIGHLATPLLPGGPAGMVAPTVGTRLAGWSRGNLVLMSAANGLYSYAPAEAQLAAVSPLPAAVPLRRPLTVAPTFAAPILCDFPYGTSTLRLSVYAGPRVGATFTLYATVQDAVTGDIVLGPTKIYTQTGGTLPCYPNNILWLPNAPAGQQVVVTLIDNSGGGSGGLQFVRYVPSTNSFGAAQLAQSNVVIDVVPFIGDPAGGFIIFYESTTTTVSWTYVHPDFTISASGTVATLGGTQTVSFPLFVYATYGASENVWFSYGTSDGMGTFNLYVAALKGDGTFTQSLAPTAYYSGSLQQVSWGIVRVAPDQVYLPYGTSSHPASNAYQANRGTWQIIRISGGLQVDQGIVPTGFTPVARPFVVGSTVYQFALLCLYLQAGVAPGDVKSQQNTLYLWQLSSNTALVNRWLPVATYAPRQVDASFTVLNILLTLGHLSFTSGAEQGVSTPTRHAVGLKTLASEVTGTNTGVLGGTWACDAFLDGAHQAEALYQAQEFGTELHLSAGAPFLFDGASAFEDSFFYFPEFTYATITGVGTTGALQYAVIYSYIDAAGLLHRSAPAFTPVLNLVNQGVVLNIPYLSATWRDVANPGQVYAEIYRTTLNGATFYLADRIVISGASTGYATWPASGVDATTDNNLSLATLLYTTGGVLDNVNPPAALIQTVHRNRKVIVDETLRATWESKAFTPGEAPGFHEQLITPYPDGGDITALASMDDKLVIFKANSIWVRRGDGPADTGQGSDWTVPERVSTDVGAKDWRGVVVGPQGVFFQTPTNQLYLLGRDLQVTNIGRTMQDEFALFFTITSATIVASQNHVRWTASNGTTSATIVYDYLFDKWAVHFYTRLSADIAHCAMSGATPAQYAVLTTDGKLWLEHMVSDATAFMDDDPAGVPHFVPTIITTAHFKAAGPMGYMRLRRTQLLVERVTSCGLQMSLQANYGATFPFGPAPPAVAPAQWTASRLDAYEEIGPAMVEYHTHAKLARSAAMSITVQDMASDASNLGNGQGCRFVSLLVDFDPLTGRYRQVPAQMRR